jgi:hypothetical protein
MYEGQQKYVTFENYAGSEHLLPFPNFIQHSVFAKQVQESSPYKPMQPISAGFIVDAKCVGMSESLRLKSRPKEDTDLLIKTLGITVDKLIKSTKPKAGRTKNQLKRDRKK